MWPELPRLISVDFDMMSGRQFSRSRGGPPPQCTAAAAATAAGGLGTSNASIICVRNSCQRKWSNAAQSAITSWEKDTSPVAATATVTIHRKPESDVLSLMTILSLKAEGLSLWAFPKKSKRCTKKRALVHM
jgi:hypothetical protein